MRVVEIWRFPVKSIGGERLEAADVGPSGIVGDRGWGVFDPATGLVLTARREPVLLMAHARLVGDAPVITLGDGTDVSTDAGLSAWLGRPVELRPAGSGPATFENPLDVEREADWVRWESSGDTFHDGRSKISFVSNGSLGDHDPRRFRINVLLDGRGEDDWTGDVTAGDCRLTIRKPIDRCVMVNRAQPGLPADREVLRRVIAERGNLMGMGAVVATPGTLREGDDLAPVG